MIVLSACVASEVLAAGKRPRAWAGAAHCVVKPQ
jgi:hypothetical protein